MAKKDKPVEVVSEGKKAILVYDKVVKVKSYPSTEELIRKAPNKK